jgi:hypothetical protein
MEHQLDRTQSSWKARDPRRYHVVVSGLTSPKLAPTKKFRSPFDYILAASGILTSVALTYYLFTHGFDGPADLGAGLVLSVPVVLAALTVLFSISMVFRPAAKAVLIGICVLVATGVYTTELYLENEGLASSSKPAGNFDSVSPEDKKQVAELAGSFGVDTRDRSELLEELRSHDVDAVPALMLASILASHGGSLTVGSNSDSRLMPIGGISNTLTVLCNETGQFVSYTSDEHGLRNPRGLWTKSRADLAAVGQSWTQGYCVADGKGFVDLLRGEYPVTLNLGISGESALLQLAAIKEYLPLVRPKIVLWFFSEGVDLMDLYEESTRPLIMRYLEPTFTQNLANRQPEIDQALRRFQADHAQPSPPPSTRTVSALFYRSLGVLKLWHLREKLDLVYGINGVDQRAWSVLPLLKETLTRSDALTRNWGGRLYFVYLPSWTRYRNGSIGPERERTAVLSLVNSLSIPIIDVEPAFRGQKDPLSLFPFGRFSHYNEAGNQVVATTVLRSISRDHQSLDTH